MPRKKHVLRAFQKLGDDFPWKAQNLLLMNLYAIEKKGFCTFFDCFCWKTTKISPLSLLCSKMLGLTLFLDGKETTTSKDTFEHEKIDALTLYQSVHVHFLFLSLTAVS